MASSSTLHRILHSIGPHKPNSAFSGVKQGEMKQETGSRATLRDVARMAGVSLATASRAVSGASGYTVSPEKRARVLDVVTQLNYQPVTAAQRSGGSAGTARRTSNVGLVL